LFKERKNPFIELRNILINEKTPYYWESTCLISIEMTRIDGFIDLMSFFEFDQKRRLVREKIESLRSAVQERG